MAGLILDGTDDLVALRQVALELSDRGVGIGQFLEDRPRRSSEASASAGWPISCCKKPRPL